MLSNPVLVSLQRLISDNAEIGIIISHKYNHKCYMHTSDNSLMGETNTRKRE